MRHEIAPRRPTWSCGGIDFLIAVLGGILFELRALRASDVLMELQSKMDFRIAEIRG